MILALPLHQQVTQSKVKSILFDIIIVLVALCCVMLPMEVSCLKYFIQTILSFKMW